MSAKNQSVWIRQTHLRLDGGVWMPKTTYWKVRAMAIADGYAMVRRKGAIPFVVRSSEIMPAGFSPKLEEVE